MDAHNELFDTDSKTPLTRLRVLRKPPSRMSTAYRRLATFAPKPEVWFETPHEKDGWESFLELELTRNMLVTLWLDEEAEVQELKATGEWKDVFDLERDKYPDD